MSAYAGVFYPDLFDDALPTDVFGPCWKASDGQYGLWQQTGIATGLFYWFSAEEHDPTLSPGVPTRLAVEISDAFARADSSIANSLGVTDVGAKPYVYPQYTGLPQNTPTPVGTAYGIASGQAKAVGPTGTDTATTAAAAVDVGSPVGITEIVLSNLTNTVNTAAGLIANVANTHRQFTSPYDQMRGYIWSLLRFGSSGAISSFLIRQGDTSGGSVTLATVPTTLFHDGMKMTLEVRYETWPDTRLIASVDDVVVSNVIDSVGVPANIIDAATGYPSRLFGFYIANTLLSGIRQGANMRVDNFRAVGYPYVPPPPEPPAVALASVGGSRVQWWG